MSPVHRLHRGHIVGTAFAVAPPLAIVAPLGLAPLLGILAAALAIWSGAHRHWPAPSRALSLTVLAFAVWASASTIWADDPMAALHILPSVVLAAVAGVFILATADDLDATERRAAGTALVAGFAIALVLLMLECAARLALDRSPVSYFFVRREFHLSIFNRGVATLALLVWPAAAVIQHRRHAGAAGLIAVTFLLVIQYESMAAILALVLGALVLAAARRSPRHVAAALAALIVLAIALAPALPRMPAIVAIVEQPGITVSVSHRMAIWHFAAKTIAARPILGWGLNASRDIPGGQEEIAAREELMPLHPHNAFLQWWLELGAVGALLGAGLILLAIRGAVGRAGALEPAAALAAVTAAVAIAAVGYGIWQGWWMCALWLAAATMATVAPKRDHVPQPGQTGHTYAKRGAGAMSDKIAP